MSTGTHRPPVELRSDTFTLPTPEMRDAMARAPVGDDVYGEDPTVRRLERRAADLLGKEAACLMPSGTMANLAAVLAQTPRGGRVLVGDASDLYCCQGGGASVVGGAVYHPLPTAGDGRIEPAELAVPLAEDRSDPQYAIPALICLENTHNRRGGAVLPPGYLAEVAELARERGVGLHLDGARIFNAAVAQGATAAELAAPADTVQFCLSKGLSAPVGSVVAGGAEVLAGVRRIRKMLGGGMRQAGVIAAAGLVALDGMVERLAEDHANARRLADGLAGLPGVRVHRPVPTNIVLFELTDVHSARDAFPDRAAFLDRARRAGVALSAPGHRYFRAVTHAGVDAADIDRAVAAIADVLNAGGIPDAARTAGTWVAPVAPGHRSGSRAQVRTDPAAHPATGPPDVEAARVALDKDGYVLVASLGGQRHAIGLLQQLGRLIPQYSGALEHEVVYRPGNDHRAYSQSRNAIRAHTEAPGWHPSPRYLALYCHRQARCGGGHTDLLDIRRLLELLEPADAELFTGPVMVFPGPESQAAGPGPVTVPMLTREGDRSVLRFSYNLLTAHHYDPPLDAAPPPEQLPLGARGVELAHRVAALFDEHREQHLIPDDGLLVWDNQRMLHARSEYADTARHLTRYWVGA
ncbi:GntG family PLP-dependent aldolase [Streptomyces sp. NPDC059002]|uniref:GntG family PLP-dependent aldolase n=1 Tax=Streptomyces sp. NPDC059002 TaxID=3346690 RepID=UPI00369DB15D